MTKSVPIILALSMISLGMLFVVILLKGYFKTMPTYEWPTADATILSSNLSAYRPTPNSANQYRLNVHYLYTYGGNSYQGYRITSRPKPYIKYHKATADLKQYPEGTITTVHINPKDPSQSLLELDSKAMLYAAAFPVILVFFGIVTLLRSIRAPGKPKPTN